MENTRPLKAEYSFIIPAYNEEQELAETLESIRIAQQRCPDRKGEVILVDNSSTDRTAEIARSYGVQVIGEPIRKISRVRNAGASVAKGDYLIFVDADTAIHPDLLRQVLEKLDTGRVCAGGAAVKYKQNPGIGAFLQRRILTFISRQGCWAAGAFVFCRRNVFEAIGGFDESIYASEDMAISKMLIQYGKEHGMEFCVLETPVRTSARKFQWYSTWEILYNQIFCQVRKKDQSKCKIWYDRPETKAAAKSKPNHRIAVQPQKTQEQPARMTANN